MQAEGGRTFDGFEMHFGVAPNGAAVQQRHTHMGFGGSAVGGGSGGLRGCTRRVMPCCDGLQPQHAVGLAQRDGQQFGVAAHHEVQHLLQAGVGFFACIVADIASQQCGGGHAHRFSQRGAAAAQRGVTVGQQPGKQRRQQ